MQRHHLVVIVGHCVCTAAVGGNDVRPDDSHQHFLPLLWQLRFISDDNVILHRVGDVVDAELKIGTFRNVHKTNASPSRGSVLRLGSRDNRHTRSKLGVLSFISVVVQSDEVKTRLHLVAASAKHVLTTLTLTRFWRAIVVDCTTMITVTWSAAIHVITEPPVLRQTLVTVPSGNQTFTVAVS